MDIQKEREAFERRQAKALNVPYEGLKDHFDENSRLFGARYDAGSINEKEWNLWLEAWQAKAQAVPEGYVLVEKAKLMQIIGSVSMIEPITRGNPYMDSVKRELTAITDVVKTVIEAQEQAND